MIAYRCIVMESTGNYIPYSGMSIRAALDAFDQNVLADTVMVQFRRPDGAWETICGVWR